ncbi:unnamed protein product [Ranitomeya imitator]|uniref:Uncharacterized protein n=1 Tax=Ranitomeya imitator TaxID=111125 RepID=A0ABN9KQE3_9NEOB|nr:unnamed protein product [Ranitomeya imitator]
MVTRVNIGLLSAALRLVTRCLPWLPGDFGIVGRWRAVCVCDSSPATTQRLNSDAAAIGIVVYIAAASLNVTIVNWLHVTIQKNGKEEDFQQPGSGPYCAHSITLLYFHRFYSDVIHPGRHSKRR